MTTEVKVIVLAHDEPELLSRTLKQLSLQSITPSQVLIVDTSDSALQDLSYPSLKLDSKTSFATAIAMAVDQLKPTGFIWLLHDDSAPHPKALELLLREVEISPSVAIVGPKQVDWENPKIIRQLGLSLTRSGKILSRVSGEYDQGQHDNLKDVLAVGTAGALISADTFRQLGGFSAKAPLFATDVDFSMRARLNGQAVIVAPNAKIDHAMYSLQGKRKRGWLKSSPAVALRHAELHLKLSYANFFAFIISWVALLPLSIISALWFLITKKPEAVLPEILGSLRAFFSVFNILQSRRLITKTTSLKPKILRSLLATRAQVKTSNQKAQDLVVSQNLLAAHSRGESDSSQQQPNLSLVASGALWWALALAVLNITWLPTNVALSGAGVSPLGGSWLEIFSKAGSDFQELGLGFVGPSDPFTWTLAILSGFTFYAPSLAVTLLVFLASPIAFIGAFQLLGMVASKRATKLVAAASYALWPTLTLSVAETQFSSIVAQLLLPWVLFGIAKLAKLGETKYVSKATSWSVLGITAVIFAMAASASPILGAFLTVVVIFIAVIKPKRAGFLLLVPSLMLVWFTPLFQFYLKTKENLLALLQDPGLGGRTNLSADWTLLFLGLPNQITDLRLFIVVPVLLLALIAFFGSKLTQALGLWAVMILGLVAAWLGLLLKFESVASGSQVSNVLPVLAVSGLMLCLLAAIAIEQVSFVRVAGLVLVIVLGLVPAAIGLALNTPKVGYSDGRIVPSIIQAEADSGSNLRTLKLSVEKDDAIAAEVIWGDGVNLHEFSTSYRIAQITLTKTDSQFDSLGQLVANLVSANGVKLDSAFAEFDIGYVLISPIDENLGLALDSTSDLESIGQTDFGQLWKVRSSVSESKETDLSISTFKIVELSVLAFFLLLAIPTGRSNRKNKHRESSIFVESEEEAGN